jgi:hypothetical protein
MNYDDFINELIPLLDEGRSLFDLEHLHQNPRFRKWRQRLTSTIDAIESHGYEIDCNVKSRIFQVASYGSVNKRDHIAAYNRELQDTINELETIIQYHKKYGDPKVRRDSHKSMPFTSSLATNEIKDNQNNNMSLKEKFESHPVIWGIGLIILGFGAGFSARPYFTNLVTTEASSKPITCTVKDIDKVEEAHHSRTMALQNQLMKLEDKASDRSLLSSSQLNYKEAADRVRSDIILENTVYQKTIASLQNKCN